MMTTSCHQPFQIKQKPIQTSSSSVNLREYPRASHTAAVLTRLPKPFPSSFFHLFSSTPRLLYIRCVTIIFYSPRRTHLLYLKKLSSLLAQSAEKPKHSVGKEKPREWMHPVRRPAATSHPVIHASLSRTCLAAAQVVCACVCLYDVSRKREKERGREEDDDVQWPTMYARCVSGGQANGSTLSDSSLYLCIYCTYVYVGITHTGVYYTYTRGGVARAASHSCGALSACL